MNFQIDSNSDRAVLSSSPYLNIELKTKFQWQNFFFIVSSHICASFSTWDSLTALRFFNFCYCICYCYLLKLIKKCTCTMLMHLYNAVFMVLENLLCKNAIALFKPSNLKCL